MRIYITLGMFTLMIFCSTKIEAQSMDFSKFSMVVNEDDFTRYFTITDREKTFIVWKKRDYQWYKANKVLVTKGGQGGPLLHGKYKEHYLNKNLKSKGQFRKGLKWGKWLSWYESGMLKTKCRYLFGFKWGREFNYDRNGNLDSITHYRKGQKVRWSKNYKKQKLMSKEKYKQGKSIKIIEFTHPDSPTSIIEHSTLNQEQTKESIDKKAIKQEQNRLKRLFEKNPTKFENQPHESKDGVVE